MNALYSIIGAGSAIPDLVVLIACIIYVNASSNADSKLLLTGSIIHFVVRIFYLVVPFLINRDYSSSADDVMQYYQLANVISLIGSVIFCIGFVMLIQRITKLLATTTRSQF